jgi:hypothetical protein
MSLKFVLGGDFIRLSNANRNEFVLKVTEFFIMMPKKRAPRKLLSFQSTFLSIKSENPLGFL